MNRGFFASCFAKSSFEGVLRRDFELPVDEGCDERYGSEVYGRMRLALLRALGLD
jgi:hypothetical protein